MKNNAVIIGKKMKLNIESMFELARLLNSPESCTGRVFCIKFEVNLLVEHSGRDS